MTAKDPEQARLAADDAHWLPIRQELVRGIEAQADVRDARVLAAFLRVPRHRFLPSDEQRIAYRDSAQPIGFEQTISQPSMIAIMLVALDVKDGERVLEIGGGSGYAAALLAELGAEVHTVEIVPELAAQARARLDELGYAHVHVVQGNGRLGLPEHAPYDKILVSAGAAEVPVELVRQLAPEGKIAIPVGDPAGQELRVGSKDADGELTWQRSIPCIFVPLIGH